MLCVRTVARTTTARSSPVRERVIAKQLSVWTEKNRWVESPRVPPVSFSSTPSATTGRLAGPIKQQPLQHRQVASFSSTTSTNSFVQSEDVLTGSLGMEDMSNDKLHTEILGEMKESTRQLLHDLLDIDSNNDNKAKSPWRHRLALSKAITLVESRGREQQKQASLLLLHLLQHQQNERRKHLEQQDSSSSSAPGFRYDESHDLFRIGIAGPPGAGKSTFIEAFGQYVLNLSENTNNEKKDSFVWCPDRLAVLCIDPSSTNTGGSILGDKTRMQELSRHSRAYVRPAPASCALGGLAPGTEDVVQLLRALQPPAQHHHKQHKDNNSTTSSPSSVLDPYSYPLVLLETVGLGQSEVEVIQSVDMLLLLIPPAGGDELQGVKKGIVEVCDMMVVTKADGHLLKAAKRTQTDYKHAMHNLFKAPPPIKSNTNTFQNTHSQHGEGEEGDEEKEFPSTTPVLMASSRNGEGLDKVWENICLYRRTALRNGSFHQRRLDQIRYWLWKHVQELVLAELADANKRQQKGANNKNSSMTQALFQQLDKGVMPPRLAADYLLRSLQRK